MTDSGIPQTLSRIVPIKNILSGPRLTRVFFYPEKKPPDQNTTYCLYHTLLIFTREEDKSYGYVVVVLYVPYN